MSYAITTSPPELSSAHNPVYFTVFDSEKPQDAVTYPNFKYIADVYVNSVLITRLKAYPDPDSFAGVFDIGPIVRSYLTNNFPTVAGSGQYQPFVSAQVKFGNDYDGTTYTNLITDTERQYYDTYKAGPYTSTVILAVNTFATDRPTIDAIESTWLPWFAASSGTLNYTENGAAASALVSYPSVIIHLPVTGAAGSTVVVVVSGQTKIVTFGCEPRFPNRKLAFLNKYGAFDTFDFTLVSRESIQIERKLFEQAPFRLGVSGALSYATNNAYHQGKTIFATRAKQRIKLTSNWLTDAAFEWLGQLVTSPEVYYSDGSYWIPVQVAANEYQYNTAAADRLKLLELDIELTGDYNTQYR
jgi:hypothetical protein